MNCFRALLELFFTFDTLDTYEFANKSIKVGFIFGGNYSTEEIDIRKRNALVRSDKIFLQGHCIRKDYGTYTGCTAYQISVFETMVFCLCVHNIDGSDEARISSVLNTSKLFSITNLLFLKSLFASSRKIVSVTTLLKFRFIDSLSNSKSTLSNVILS